MKRLYWNLRYSMHTWPDKFGCWTAHRMPRWLVKRCAVRLGVHAITGPHSKTVVPDLTYLDALKRWDERHVYYSMRRDSRGVTGKAVVT